MIPNLFLPHNLAVNHVADGICIVEYDLSNEY